MAVTFMGKYPRLVKYKSGQSSYPGCVALLIEPGSAIILYIPTPVSEANANLSLGERVSITNTEIEEYSGGITIRSDKDPQLIS